MFILYVQTQYGEGYYCGRDCEGQYQVTNNPDYAEKFITYNMAHNRMEDINNHEYILDYKIIEF